MMEERDAARARVEELEVELSHYKGAAGAENPSAQDLVDALNARTELPVVQRKGEELASACRRIVNDPLSRRDQVQSALLNAIQAFEKK